MDLGVSQRIDGTDSEQAGIREVIAKMNVYWIEEVLSKRQYESVRTDW
jgi:hypothetical protein